MKDLSQRLLESFAVDVSGELEKVLFREPKPFLTGSRVYGTPRHDSDWDVVFLMSPEEAVLLGKVAKGHIRGLSKLDEGLEMSKYGHPCIYYKEWNFIFVKDIEMYQAWKEGTDYLAKMAPVSKEIACTLFDEYRGKARYLIAAREVGGVELTV